MAKDFTFLKSLLDKEEDKLNLSLMICSVTSHALRIVENSKIYLELKELVNKNELTEEDLLTFLNGSLEHVEDPDYPFEFAIVLIAKLTSLFPLKNNCLLEQIIENEVTARYCWSRICPLEILKKKMIEDYIEAKSIFDFLESIRNDYFFIFYSRGNEQRGPIFDHVGLCYNYLIKSGVIT